MSKDPSIRLFYVTNCDLKESCSIYSILKLVAILDSTMHFFIQSIILHFVEAFHFRDTAINFQGV